MRTRFTHFFWLSSFEGMNFFQKPLEIFLKDSIIEIVFEKNRSGNNGEKVTPVPIPNTEVKLLSADGSWDFVPVRVGRCQALYCSAVAQW
jgi:hypothetical protein